LLKKKVVHKTDEELVRIIVEQNQHDDFGILYDRYSEKVYHKCISFVKDLDLAKDLAHDVFLKTFVNLSKFNHQSKFSTWLYSLTYNFCIDYLRKNNKMRMESEDTLINIADSDDEKNERELLSMEAKRLKYVLDHIPSKDKMILLMKYQDDLSVKDIQDALGVNESAVKMRVKRARAKAIEVYNEQFGHER
jgi:RNA polymerase sigma-70 factor (ECF subfamily)